MAAPRVRATGLDAGPGSGKTTALAQTMIEAGARVGPSRVAGVSFTRRSTRELAWKCRELGGRDRMPGSITTLHALAWHVLKLAATAGLVPAPRLRGGGWKTPDKFYTGAVLRAVLEERDGYAPPGPWVADYRGRLDAMGALDQALLLMDATRILRQSPRRVLDIALLGVDEAQDLHPSAWGFIDAVMAGADDDVELLFAGEALQSLYGFTGARPEIFEARLRVADAVETLHQSRRCCDPVARFVNAIGGVHRLTPMGRPGEVRCISPFVNGLDDADAKYWPGLLAQIALDAAQSPGFTLGILARSGWMLKPIATALRQLGTIPYTLLGEKLAGRHVDYAPEVRALLAAVNAWRGKQYTPAHATLLTQWNRGQPLRRRGGSYDDGWMYETLTPPPDASEQCVMAWRYRQRFALEKQSGVRPWLTCSTIHGAKGAEFSTVFWITGGDDADPPAERTRLRYVCASRAKTCLRLWGHDPTLQAQVLAAGGTVTPPTVLGRLASAVRPLC